MENTKMTLVPLDNVSVITASGPVPDKFTFKLNGINDCIKGNASITAFRNGVQDSVFENSSTGNAAGAVNFLNGFLGNGTVKDSDMFASGRESLTISKAFGIGTFDADGESKNSFVTPDNFNDVTFEWKNNLFQKVVQ